MHTEHAWRSNALVRGIAAAAAVTLLVGAVPQPNHAQGATEQQAIEFVAAANLIEHNAKLQAVLLLPARLQKIRGLVSVVHQGLMSERSQGPRRSTDGCRGRLWPRFGEQHPASFQPSDTTSSDASLARNVALSGEIGLSRLLERLAEDSGHRELRHVPLLFWGFSASAGFGTTFAIAHPERTIGFVRYHSHRRGLTVTFDPLKNVPALLMSGGKDEAAGVEDAQQMWAAARAAGAPWTFAIEPQAPHSSIEIHESTMRELTLPWMAAVLRLRLSDRGELRRIQRNDGWVGNHRTLDVTPLKGFSEDLRTASWLPDEASARGWKSVGQRK